MEGADSNDGSPWTSSPCENDEKRPGRVEKKSNVLPLWGNERTMNLNPLILTNIQSSHYFKVNLYELKTYHEVVDEIYYKVTHLEPWEKGSRKTAGQTGMCGGVRGVGAGGIVSTAYCLLYKLFTLKLTRKQVNGLLTHPDSPYIRGLGFMYLRYTQPPPDLWDWYDEYLEDPEEMDCKAGGGQVMSIGEILRAFLTKLEWFSTLFPRIPVPIQQMLQRKMAERFPPPPPPPIAAPPVKQARPAVRPAVRPQVPAREARHIPDEEVSFGEAERFSRLRRPEGVSVPGRAPDSRDNRDRKRGHSGDRERERDRRAGHGSADDRAREKKRPHAAADADRGRERKSGSSHRREREEGGGRSHGGGGKESHRSRDKERRRRDVDDGGFSEELRREKHRQSKDRYKDNGKSRHKHRS